MFGKSGWTNVYSVKKVWQMSMLTKMLLIVTANMDSFGLANH